MKRFFTKSTVLAIFSFFCLEAVNGQTMNHHWLKSFGGESYERGNCIAVDESGNSFIAGFFAETADFDPGEESFLMTAIGHFDSFIVRLNASGDLVWARQLGGIDSYTEALSLTLDAEGNVYIVGYFNATVDFDPSEEGVYQLTSAGNKDVFICKLNSQGEFVWAHKIGIYSEEQAFSVTVSPQGNLLIAGCFEGTVNLNPVPDQQYWLTSNGGWDIFILKLTADGHFIWARRVGGEYWDYYPVITTNALEEVFVVGSFQVSGDFNPGEEEYILESMGGEDGFFLKLNADGDFMWAHRIGGSGYDRPTGIAVAPDGDVIVGGTFSSIVDFDFSEEVFELTEIGDADLFLARYTTDGELVWVTQMGGAESEFLKSMAIDLAGNIYCTGGFYYSTDLNPLGAPYAFTSAGMADGFVSMHNSYGNLVWAGRMGGSQMDWGSGIAVDTEGNVYITGTFHDVADFPPHEANHILTSLGSEEVFVFKMSVDYNAGLHNESDKQISLLFPNPTSDFLNIHLGSEFLGASYSIIDLTGRVIKEGIVDSEQFVLSVSNLAAGAYFFKLRGKILVVDKFLKS